MPGLFQSVQSISGPLFLMEAIFQTDHQFSFAMNGEQLLIMYFAEQSNLRGEVWRKSAVEMISSMNPVLANFMFWGLHQMEFCADQNNNANTYIEWVHYKVHLNSETNA